MLDVLLAVVMGQFLFRVPLRGTWRCSSHGGHLSAGALSLGMVISIVTKKPTSGQPVGHVLTFLPSFLLSGFMYAIGNMPHAIQLVTYLIPARYFVALLKGIYLKGIGLELLALEAGLLTVFGAAMVLFANLKFKKEAGVIMWERIKTHAH